MNSFQTIEEVNDYFEKQLESLYQNYTAKLQIVEKNKIQIYMTLQRQYEEQLIALEQRKQNEGNLLKQNSDLAVGKIKLLFENKIQIILEKYKSDYSEEVNGYRENKVEMLGQMQVEERVIFKHYQHQQMELLRQGGQSRQLVAGFEQKMDNLQSALLNLCEKYEHQFSLLEEKHEEKYELLEQMRDEAIEQLLDSEKASQNQLEDQLFEKLQNLNEKIEQQRDILEQELIEKEHSLEEMVNTERERIELDYEQKCNEVFEQQEQALAQFD
ncbi:hypothetical protein [Solibacillus merdavium]|uniref:Uncharacterized protein n=1 Tax=Solibacillus merdavium TaxID=2762218 RepID=A0ABR8XSP3_9BACL|nr:hypothetical protein [Solibacillus merdavium]MBD8034965.1 hypothetical protein [Solibacillus merdavium]